MLNYLWAGMILTGIIYAVVTGRIPEVTNAAIDSSREAVTLCITMMGVISLWSGLMEIASKAGVIESVSGKLRPLLKFLYPDLPAGHPAQKSIATNMIANFLGLGWAATPAGLLAMEELAKLNGKTGRASNAMCMFLVVNMSSLQLVTVNILAYRAEYGSAAPAEIMGAGIAATLGTTLVGILLAKILEGRGKHCDF